MVDSPPVGDSVVPEMLLKVLAPYRREGGSMGGLFFIAIQEASMFCLNI